jgi:hypothetical protein
MDAADLLARATYYRTLAARVTDEQTRAGLLELAEKYEALVRGIQADDPQKAQ